jgi:peptidyl-Lys metalloendopeptidase
MMRAVALMLMSVVLTQACAQERPMQLLCELQIAPTLAARDTAELTFALTNAGTQPVQVLTWHTPFEGVRNPMLAVKRDTKELEYRGMMLKRGPPRADAYLTLQPGERREARIDLAKGWEVAAPGIYTVEYVGELMDVIAGKSPAPRSSGAMQPLALSCPAVTFTRSR